MLQSDISPSELLAWYADAGIDIALLDEPVDRFAEADAQRKVAKSAPTPTKSTSASSPAAPSTAPTTARQEPAVPDSNSIALATETAKSASSLKELQQAIEGFQNCNLKFTARSTLFACGNPNAKIMLVGGMPGREEDAQGECLIGPAGQLLDRMLAAIGLDREQTYIANCAPWRPPGGRTMSPAEMEICHPFLKRHIQLADPDLLILLGGVATKLLLKNKRDIMGLRGKWAEYPVADRAIPVLPILSPDYLLKNPAHKNLAWQDLLSVKARLAKK